VAQSSIFKSEISLFRVKFHSKDFREDVMLLLMRRLGTLAQNNYLTLTCIKMLYQNQAIQLNCYQIELFLRELTFLFK